MQQSCKWENIWPVATCVVYGAWMFWASTCKKWEVFALGFTFILHFALCGSWKGDFNKEAGCRECHQKFRKPHQVLSDQACGKMKKLSKIRTKYIEGTSGLCLFFCPDILLSILLPLQTDGLCKHRLCKLCTSLLCDFRSWADSCGERSWWSFFQAERFAALLLIGWFPKWF